MFECCSFDAKEVHLCLRRCSVNPVRPSFSRLARFGVHICLRVCIHSPFFHKDGEEIDCKSSRSATTTRSLDTDPRISINLRAEINGTTHFARALMHPMPEFVALFRSRPNRPYCDAICLDMLRTPNHRTIGKHAQNLMTIQDRRTYTECRCALQDGRSTPAIKTQSRQRRHKLQYCVCSLLCPNLIHIADGAKVACQTPPRKLTGALFVHSQI